MHRNALYYLDNGKQSLVFEHLAMAHDLIAYI